MAVSPVIASPVLRRLPPAFAVSAIGGGMLGSMNALTPAVKPSPACRAERERWVPAAGHAGPRHHPAGVMRTAAQASQHLCTAAR
jgi:hypothetical protein